MIKPKHVFFGVPAAFFAAWLVMMFNVPTWADLGPPHTAFTIFAVFIGMMVPLLVLGNSRNKNNWGGPWKDPGEQTPGEQKDPGEQGE